MCPECLYVACTRILYVHRHRLFFVTWIECTSEKGDDHLRELPLRLSLKWKLLLPWRSGTRKTWEIRPPRETWDNRIPWKWQAGLTDREEHVSNMPPYASDTFEKLAVKRGPLKRLLSSSWNLSDLLKKSKRICLLLRCIYRYLLWFISFYVCFCNIYLHWFIHAIFWCLPQKKQKCEMGGRNVSRK